MMREYLKQARERMGYTQQFVAEQINISQNYYCDIENGVRQKEIKAHILLKLSNVLNIPIDEMLKKEENLRSQKKRE